MEINQKLIEMGLATGIILGYITILIGIVMTVLLLETIFLG